jgi:hypothetical protein
VVHFAEQSLQRMVDVTFSNSSGIGCSRMMFARFVNSASMFTMLLLQIGHL